MAPSNKGCFWKLAAPFYDRFTALFLARGYARMKAWALELVPEGTSVLELGAGTGALTSLLAPRCSRYVATDFSPAMLEILARLPGVEVARHDATEPWPETGAFDTVIMSNVLHLLDRPELALATAHQALRPGGLILAPHFCHGQTLFSTLLWALLRRIGFPVRQRYHARDMAALLERCGFQVEPFEMVPGLIPMVLLQGRRPWGPGAPTSADQVHRDLVAHPQNHGGTRPPSME